MLPPPNRADSSTGPRTLSHVFNCMFNRGCQAEVEVPRFGGHLIIGHAVPVRRCSRVPHPPAGLPRPSRPKPCSSPAVAANPWGPSPRTSGSPIRRSGPGCARPRSTAVRATGRRRASARSCATYAADSRRCAKRASSQQQPRTSSPTRATRSGRGGCVRRGGAGPLLGGHALRRGRRRAGTGRQAAAIGIDSAAVQRRTSRGCLCAEPRAVDDPSGIAEFPAPHLISSPPAQSPAPAGPSAPPRG